MEAIVLSVDDDVSVCRGLSEELRIAGYTTHWITNGNDAIEYVLSRNVDIRLLDLRMPETDGFQVLRELQKKKIKIKVLALTEYSDVKGAAEAVRIGASYFINKPCDLDELLISIRKVLSDF